MEKAHFFPLISGLVGSASPSVGKSLHFLFAVVIGATFAATDRAPVGALATASFGDFSGRSRSSHSAISFLLGALVSRFGWIAVGRISGRDPESVFASQKV